MSNLGAQPIKVRHNVKLDPDYSSVLGVIKSHTLFLWGMWSIVVTLFNGKKIIEVGSFPCCQSPKQKFETTWCLKSLVLNLG